MRRYCLNALIALALAAPLAACHEPGPAERAGRSLDNAGEAIRDAVDPPQGPGERLGRSIDRATR